MITSIEIAGEKDRNALLVFDSIIETQNISSIDIIHKTKVSPATVSRVTTRLRNLGLVEIQEKEIASAGRSPILYSINPNYGYLSHYEMRAKAIDGYLSDLNGNILEEIHVPIEQEVSMMELVNLLKKAHDSLIAKRSGVASKLLTAGVSVPGVVNQDTMQIDRIPDIYRFRNANVYESITNALSIPVIINNVAFLALAGEKNVCYPDYKDIAYINFTNYYGVGGGIVINNEMCRGNRSAAGEIGDMFFDKSNFDMAYRDNMGCLESYAGLKSMYDRVVAMMQKGRAKKLKRIMEEEHTEKLSLTLIEKAVKQQDYDVQDIWDDTLRIWAVAIINIVSLVDPELVIIGGSVNSENTLTLERVKQFVSKGLYYNPDIRLSTLGNQAQIHGGIYELRNYVFNKILAETVINY